MLEPAISSAKELFFTNSEILWYAYAILVHFLIVVEQTLQASSINENFLMPMMSIAISCLYRALMNEFINLFFGFIKA